VAAALGQRATKDSADAFVYGVLPPAKAVGRMVARRVAEALGNSLSGSGAKGTGGGGGVDVGLVGELAREIAQEYATDLQRGAQLGPLADLVEAVKGPTSKLAADMRSLGEAVGGAAERALASSQLSSAPPSAAQAATPVSAVRTARPPPPPPPSSVTSGVGAEVEAKRRRVAELRKLTKRDETWDETWAPRSGADVAAEAAVAEAEAAVEAAAKVFATLELRVEGRSSSRTNAQSVTADFLPLDDLSVDADFDAADGVVEADAVPYFDETLTGVAALDETVLRSAQNSDGNAARASRQAEPRTRPLNGPAAAPPSFWRESSALTSDAAAAADRGVAFDVDVSVIESAPDAEEVSRKRQAVFVDAFFLSAEAMLGTRPLMTSDDLW